MVMRFQTIGLFTLAAAALFPFGGCDNVVAKKKFWDPSGNSTFTSDIFVTPYGPALVMQVTMKPSTTYTIKIDPSKIKDKKGQTLAEDVNGAVKTTYSFTTEPAYPL